MIRLIAAVIACALLGGCGYKLGEIRPTPMRSVRNLAVPTFKNKTYEPRVEVLLADTLIKTLQEDGTYTIVSEDNAEAILNCTLTKIERSSLRSVQNNVLATAEFGLRLDVAYQERSAAIRLSLATAIFRRPSARQSLWLRGMRPSN